MSEIDTLLADLQQIEDSAPKAARTIKFLPHPPQQILTNHSQHPKTKFAIDRVSPTNSSSTNIKKDFPTVEKTDKDQEIENSTENINSISVNSKHDNKSSNNAENVESDNKNANYNSNIGKNDTMKTIKMKK